MLGSSHRQRGDTIIEVLFAVAVFSLLAVGAMSVMNRGTAISQRALEVTLVRQQIDAQAEALRFIHHAYVIAYGTESVDEEPASEWAELASLAKSSASTFGDEGCAAIPPNSFIMNARSGRVHSGTITPMSSADSLPFPQVTYQGDPDTGALTSIVNSVDGIWIEAVSSPTTHRTGFIDFHIRTCWFSSASGAPSTIGTIVRLYEPRA